MGIIQKLLEIKTPRYSTIMKKNIKLLKNSISDKFNDEFFVFERIINWTADLDSIKLTDIQLIDYTGLLYISINKFLRGIDKSSNTIDKIDKIMKNYTNWPKLPIDTIVYRCISSSDDLNFDTDIFKYMKIGTFYEDKAFISTSLCLKNKICGNKGKCFFKIILKKGMPYFYLENITHHKEEYEILLMSGLSFELVEKGHIEMENSWYPIYTFICSYNNINDLYNSSLLPKIPILEFFINEKNNFYGQHKKLYHPIDTIYGARRLNLEYHKLDTKKVSYNLKDVKLMTWNIHEFKAAEIYESKENDQIDKIIDFIKDFSSDILCLQEGCTNIENKLNGYNFDKCIADRATSNDCSTDGKLVNYVFVNNNSSKVTYMKPSLIECCKLKHDDRCFVFSTVKINNKEVVIINCHLSYKLNEGIENIKEILLYIKTNIKHNNIIIVGDMNSYKEQDYNNVNKKNFINDKINIHKLNKDLIFEAITIIEKEEFIDVFNKISLLPPKNSTIHGGRIDFIFTKKNNDIIINDAFTLYTELSDHIPMFIDFSVK